MVEWYEEPEKILDDSNPPFYKWFPDGKLNMCYNCVDRHATKEKGHDIALVYDSTIVNVVQKYTWHELLDHVSRLGGLIQSEFKVKKGERVIIYMPMIPEAVFAMLACARVGAIHSVVFGGFAPKELASRIADA